MSNPKERNDDGRLSPCASVEPSLMSTRTEDHNDLYDHRQHPVAIARKQSVADDSGPMGRNVLTNPRGSSEKQKSREENSQARLGRIRSGKLVDESQDEYPEHVRPIPRATVSKSSAGWPARAPHSASQQTLYGFPRERADTEKDAGVSGTDGGLKSRRGSRTLSIVDTGLRRKMSRAQSETSSQGGNLHFLSRTFSHKSQDSGLVNVRRNRRMSADSDDSNASRESQETEEDVCFPMQQPEHTRINGIDFDELEEFAQESLRANLTMNINVGVSKGDDVDMKCSGSPGSSTGTSTSISSAAMKYTPKGNFKQKDSSNETAPGISFGNNKVETGEYLPMNDLSSYANESAAYDTMDNGNIPADNYKIPDRFSFFCSEAGETVHAPDIPSLVQDGETFRELFRDGAVTWWLDCSCPTDEEMRCIAKAFGIHPLTAEDIRMQEPREKVELFKSYYFVCFHTFENDPESADFLEPINMYIVVFRNGVLTFHFSPVSHSANVRRRVRQLRDYVDVNSDWICYALIDDITDSFAPVIQTIEYEADVIEDCVFMTGDLDVSRMLQTIGEGRRKTMTLMRLLSGKADVIKMFAKRCQDEANGIGPALTSEINIANLQASGHDPLSARLGSNIQHHHVQRTQPRADIALYLGDIQDHVLTMFQNLLSYEKIFSRSHGNYLAQLQVESFRCNNRVTEMLGKVTMIGTMLVPLNLVTGLFGMNVTVPGEATGELHWFFGILAILVGSAVGLWFLSSWWISKANSPRSLNDTVMSGTRSILNFARRNRNDQCRPEGNKSVISCPSKYARYY
ncbi:ADL171Wp [Eremothecium gossypii ATCC 10895]|uniref:ADL171Wp n=1 Tax=Eremothecium gossypii (strain ATCC 10895 / CBS 109.51 / FGSC 9923 / NRRL Y-1056) TaxID=284811 RepID=Q75AU1_EREGS|nr:ADL171Wp [Eremothecium gossypii ATCC 10895]AAS51749.1 ADL171Wp [Eremothecium gossypii ATCC 10895]AEY96046.1 FADL171Wp [Eremothecium gossypii FDAG1]